MPGRWRLNSQSAKAQWVCTRTSAAHTAAAQEICSKATASGRRGKAGKLREKGGGRGEGGGADLEAAEHGEEGLSDDSTEEQVAEGGHCQPTGACLQGLDL